MEGDYVLIGTDAKFGEIYAKLSKDGPIISSSREGEPCFVIRGRDSFAADAVDGYASVASPMGVKFTESVDAVVKTIEDWQEANKVFVHDPD